MVALPGPFPQSRDCSMVSPEVHVATAACDRQTETSHIPEAAHGRRPLVVTSTLNPAP